MICNPTTAATQADHAHGVVFPAGAVVFDDAFPGVRAIILTAGPEQSEVAYEDGAVRCRPNSYLYAYLCDGAAADDEQCTAVSWRDQAPEAVAARIRLSLRAAAKSAEVELAKPALPVDDPPVPAAVRQGQEAWKRLHEHSTWEDWKQVGAAHVIGRTEAMLDGHVNTPKGRSYNAAFNAWQKKFGFADLDRGDRTRLFQVMDHLDEIEGWLKELKSTERLRLNHPNSVWRRWKKATATLDPNAPPKTSPYKKLQAERMALIAERDLYKREVERGGGDLWAKTDRVRDISKVMIDQLGKTKAGKVAREILSALNDGRS
jgi:hypothetical protein